MSDEDSYAEIPRLEGWLTFPEAGEELGVSKQMIHKMVFLTKPPILNKIRRVGDRPIYLVDEEEVRALKERRTQEE